MRSRLAWLVCGVGTILVVVCGCAEDSGTTVAETGQSNGSAAPTSPAPRPAPPPARKPVVVKQDAFPGVPQALAALNSAVKANDREGVATAEGWFELQQTSAVPPLVAVVEDANADFELRLSACRALSRIGPPAAESLERLLSIEPQQLQLRAMESLSRIKPVRPSTVSIFRELLKPGEVRVRQVALECLGRIGPPAKDAVPDLVAILNDTNENETLRGEAKQALKVVEPRRGLMGLAQ